MLTAHLQKIDHDHLGQIVRYIVTPAGNIRMFPGFLHSFKFFYNYRK